MGRAILAGFANGALTALAVLVLVSALLPPPPERAPTRQIVSAAPSVTLRAGAGRPEAARAPSPPEPAAPRVPQR